MPKLRNIMLSFFSISILLFSQNSMASTKIAIIDTQKIIDKSTARQTIIDQIKRKGDSFKAQLQETENTLKEESETLDSQRGTITNEAFESKKKGFQKRVLDKKHEFQSKHKKLLTAEKKAMKELSDKILSIVESLAKERNFSLALPKAAALYSAPSLDITDDVLNQLNKELPKISVNVGK